MEVLREQKSSKIHSFQQKHINISFDFHSGEISKAPIASSDFWKTHATYFQVNIFKAWIAKNSS